MIKLGMIGVALGLVTGGFNEAYTISEPVAEIGESSDPIDENENEDGGRESNTVTKTVFWIDNGETVVDNAGKYGEIITSAESGEIGDEIKVFITCNSTFDIDTKKVTFFRYALSYVTVNGNKIEPTNAEKHEYSFVLEEGVNDVKAYFSGRVEINATDLSTVNWKSFLTVDNLLKIVYFVLSLAVAAFFFVVSKKILFNKKKSDDDIEKSVETIFAGKINNFLADTIKPIVEKQSVTTKDVLDGMNVLTRVTMFQLSGKPEDRLAALKELQDYRPTNVELGDQIKKIVEDAIQKSEESKEAKKKAVADAVESVETFDTEKDSEIDAYDHVKL